MSDQTPAPPERDIPEAVVEPGRGVSTIWFVPLIAAAVALSLLYKAIESRGESFKIYFETASGVEAGKTTVRYRDVVVGTVEGVRLSHDLTQTVVEARINPSAESVLVEGTRFWVERPRIGPHGISGLTTLVSGAYIALDPGPTTGKPLKHFKGLVDPPQNLRDDKGLRLTLTSPHSGRSLNYGAPVLLEGIPVGHITGVELPKKGSGVEVEISIEATHTDRVHENTRFWNASGVDIHAGLSGIDVRTGSIESVLAGGIGMATPGRTGKQAAQGQRFSLFESREAALRHYQESLGLHITVTTKHLGSVADGDPILYRGETVGRVLSHELASDARHILIQLQIDDRYAPLVRNNSVFWNASGATADLGFTGLHLHVSSLESLLEGAIAFATPDPPGPPAKTGALFELAPEGKDKWRKWSPKLPMN